jgi:PPOX class probable F420-dependent enzyme
MADQFVDFSKAQYLSFETYRKNGTAVATPVWFAAGDDGLLYIYSEQNAGKVKRVRNNPTVRVAPCDIRGNLRGEWAPATARVLTDATEVSRADALLDKKYRWQRMIGNILNKLRRRGRDFIAIRLG